jgi:hypothetical protein
MLCAGDGFVKRVRVLVANHPRLMRELVMATIADQASRCSCYGKVLLYIPKKGLS